MNNIENLKAAIAHLEQRLTEVDSKNEWFTSIQLQLEIRKARLAKVAA